MKKISKFLSLLLCITLAAALLAGCAKKSTPPAEDSPSSNPTDSTGDSSSPDPADSASGEFVAPDVLRVGMECDFPPHNWTQLSESEYSVPMQDGTFADGYDVQIAKMIAEELGCELQVVKIEWDGLLPSMTSNKIDLIIAGMTDDADRRLSIDFTDVYWSSDLVIVVTKEGPFANATSLADFTGAKITAQLNTLHYDKIDMIPDVQKELAMADFPTMLMALSSGKIDGYVAERPAAISAQLSNPNVTFIAFEGDNGFDEEMPVSIGIRKGEEALRDKISEILAGITVEQRQALMEEAVSRQPLQG